ncbi:methylated-DNA--[protein]-cysteine S-methyltransferase [Devosia sp. XJ19-1]|uniref:methylated-DNA--[protein]-cysteine S-methyltransferase n=1 Tax=Devosia ureilytica TaxID=2952754 RepID=A0A9Q4AMR9_9HYPH|nr:methylated-DNA--[protein]-cysteine S-methyltransferase [Devosia ureilytica]MCP8883415.1 methylated-DNA--[protein]-cysteine S-methyltransferase [Devosia ureilytica]MCP8887023.1 methylated-DNA--[protein]-cysteine S-methyltransferase [Devosia ureilytica]
METTTFDTALGRFGIGWTDKGLARLLLPGDDETVLLERLNRGTTQPGEPTRMISALMNSIEDYAEGEAVDFADVPLDLAGVPDFHSRAYDLLIKIGWGQTVTYGDLARQLGDIGLSRAVGQAMGANPIPLVIPCHRVLASDGKPGGFSAPGGTATKVKMLALEGVSIGTPAGQMTFGF